MVDAAGEQARIAFKGGHPVFWICRQDRKDQPRRTDHGQLVANCCTPRREPGGFNDRTRSSAGFFDIPVDISIAAPVLIKYLRQQLTVKRRRFAG